jgi:cation:H+ antiporter
MDFIVFITAMAALVYGADFVIRESERIALHFYISHFVIGATLVAFGTSLPEMAASMTASAQGKSDMAIANVIGSVTFNITLVLGIVFFIARFMNPERNLFAKDSAWVLFPVIIFMLMIHDGSISRFDGFLFLFIMASYLIFLFHSAKETLESELDEEIVREKFRWMRTIGLLAVGFVLTIGGAGFVIESGSSIARSFGVSEWIIGLFMVALGTSLPELVVSIVAIKKGNADLSVGNIIGSNVANFSMVLGSAALISPLDVHVQANWYDIMIMIASSLALLLILANKLYNKAGAIFLFVILALFIQNSILTLHAG